MSSAQAQGRQVGALTTNLAAKDTLLQETAGELQEHQLLSAQLGAWGSTPGHSLLLATGNT
jgi:hypothetical protein